VTGLKAHIVVLTVEESAATRFVAKEDAELLYKS
jgi:hypothetical protein